MKKLLFTSILFIAQLALVAQTDALSYQAVIIDNEALEIPGSDVEGLPLVNGQVGFRFTIYETTGEILYQETQQTVTDEFGMVNLVIGQGEMTGESNLLFDEIDWDGLPKDLGVELRYENSEYEELTREALLFLPYAFHRNITATGTLEVDGSSLLRDSLSVLGDTELGGSLTVANSSPTELTGELNVQGESNFEQLATFDEIRVLNTSTLEGPVFIDNESPADFSGSLDVDGITTLDATLNVNASSALNGQVTINADVDGSQSSYSAYPLRVQGSNQGIAVRVDGGESETKNFLSFFNGSGAVKGRVEGQTLSELQSSFRFIWDVTMGGLEQAFIAAEGVACAGQLDIAESVVMVANTALYGAQWVELTANYEFNVGVAFLSGGADYAEWIEKANAEEDLFPGEVVGIHRGKASKITSGADHFLAVSTNPIVLGNMPPEGREEAHAKIAFLGQVPIRVVGKVSSGDYILPSGKNDGMAVAFSPERLPAQRYREIIGVAWENSNSEAPALVNVALGLNKNDLSDKVARLETQMDDLREEIEAIKRQLAGEPVNKEELSESLSEKSTSEPMGSSFGQAVQPNMSDEEFEAWLADYGYLFENQMQVIRDGFDERGIDYKRFDEVALIVDSPLEALRKMKSGEFLSSLWDNFERRLKKSGE